MIHGDLMGLVLVMNCDDWWWMVMSGNMIGISWEYSQYSQLWMGQIYSDPTSWPNPGIMVWLHPQVALFQAGKNYTPNSCNFDRE